ncbi:hypothetical protein Tco_0712146 [Tanacetum coccineum]
MTHRSPSLPNAKGCDGGKGSNHSWSLLPLKPAASRLVNPTKTLDLNLIAYFQSLDMLKVASSGWSFVFAVPSLMTHLVASLTLDSASWGGSISPDGFLPSILLLVVIIVAVVIVVVTAVIVVVVVVAIIVIVVVVLAWFQEKYSCRTRRGIDCLSSQANCPLIEK